jgi:iron complex transport system substrate-binding protein
MNTLGAALLALAGLLPAAARAAPLTLQDDTGATVTLAGGPAARIVSLAPGATEMLFAAGAGDRIVATVAGADYPAAAKKIERVGDATALQFKKMLALKPDVIIVWENLTNRVVVETLHKLGVPLWFVRARELADIPKTIRRFGELAGTQATAGPAADALGARLQAIAQRHKVKGKPLSAFYMIEAEPLYTLGARHIVTDALALCGARNIFDDIDFPAPIVEFKKVVERDPELIVLSAPPISARDWRERWSQFPSIRAVQKGLVLTFDDGRLDRMGPSAIDALDGLCQLVARARAAYAH